MTDQPTRDPLAIVCVDPDCPDYGTPEDASSPHAGAERLDPDIMARRNAAHGSGAADQADDYGFDNDEDVIYWPADVIVPASTGYERLWGFVRTGHRLGGRDVGRNHHVSLWLDLRSWNVGASSYYGDVAINVGPLRINVTQPPF